MKALFITPVLLNLLLLSCGNKTQEIPRTLSSDTIVGELEWYDVTRLKKGHPANTNAQAVAHLTLPVLGSRCTGFLISEDVIMTNQHCIPTSGHARGVTAVFNYVDGVSKLRHKKYKCDTFIGNNKDLDYALLKCQGNPGRTQGVVTLSRDEAVKNDEIYVIQQNCDYYLKRGCEPTKKIAFGNVIKVHEEYVHNADTLGGSSGSPVFDEDHKVVGLHHVGVGDRRTGRGEENWAVPMWEIVNDIQARFMDLGDREGDGVDDPRDLDEPQSKDREPNNTSSQAADVELGEEVNGNIQDGDDIDYFSLKLGQSGRVSLELNFLHKKGDLDLYLLNSSKKVVAKSTSTKDSESLSKYLTKGQYYVVVLGYKDASGEYRLEF